MKGEGFESTKNKWESKVDSLIIALAVLLLQRCPYLIRLDEGRTSKREEL